MADLESTVWTPFGTTTTPLPLDVHLRSDFEVTIVATVAVCQGGLDISVTMPKVVLQPEIVDCPSLLSEACDATEEAIKIALGEVAGPIAKALETEANHLFGGSSGTCI